MKVQMNFKYDDSSASTGYSGYYSSVTAQSPISDIKYVNQFSRTEDNQSEETGKYTIFDVANWFLHKQPMTQKKLQKMCYYAQAWCYALKGYRLADTDFQAWIHGPVSPALYDRFKSFGFKPILMKGDYKSPFKKEDEELLEDVWTTYGDETGNSLEALSHREEPWIKARRGYEPNERCMVVITPESMKEYYQSIYSGDKV